MIVIGFGGGEARRRENINGYQNTSIGIQYTYCTRTKVKDNCDNARDLT